MTILEILTTDPELVAWRKQYREMGLYMPGWNYDCFHGIADYKEYIKKDLEKRKAERNMV